MRFTKHSVLMLFELVFIYIPGSAIIPVTIILALIKPVWAILFFLICVAIIGGAFWVKPKLARSFGAESREDDI